MSAVDLVLGKRVPAPLLPHVNEFCLGTTLVEQPFVREVIVNDDVGFFYTLETLDCDESRISGTGAD